MEKSKTRKPTFSKFIVMQHRVDSQRGDHWKDIASCQNTSDGLKWIDAHGVDGCRYAVFQQTCKLQHVTVVKEEKRMRIDAEEVEPA